MIQGFYRPSWASISHPKSPTVETPAIAQRTELFRWVFVRHDDLRQCAVTTGNSHVINSHPLLARALLKVQKTYIQLTQSRAVTHP
jgi:hypothetical protein